ncbi:g8278 [Coccomyxa viridis]|uniref:G8278 protein n=1 Tax=Coccomyxa viridis TaxID=1274662 RepID=A0ABP1FZY7_9CHLO
MQGRGYIPLPALGIEAVADVEQQIMGLFSYITASEMTLAIRMADVDYPVKKSLSTILEAARADNPELVELDRNSRSLPVYVNLAPLFNAKGEATGTSKAVGTAIHSEKVTTAVEAVSKGSTGSQGTRPPWRDPVMSQWYPRDEAGAYNRQTVEGLPNAWAEGIVSLTQLAMQEQRMAVDDRKTIRRHMFKEARCRNNRIHGPDDRTKKPGAKALHQYAMDGIQWNKDHGAQLQTGGIPHQLASANEKAKKSFILAEGRNRDLQDLHYMSEIGETSTRDTKTRSGQLQAINKLEGRDGDGRGQRGRKRKVAASDNGNEATASRCANDEGDGDAQTHAGQNRRAPAETPQPPESGARSSERQKQVPEQQDGAESAPHNNALATEATGDSGHTDRQLGADVPSIEPAAEEIGMVAAGPSTPEGNAKREDLAISDEELAQTLLGLTSSSRIESLRAAKLFWPGEELMDVGGGRYVWEVGDVPMGKWMQKEAQVVAMLAIHEATAIVDERKCPLCKTREYLGFELSTAQWLPHKTLAAIQAMAAWAQKRGQPAADGQWHISCHALWTHASACASEPSATLTQGTALRDGPKGHEEAADKNTEAAAQGKEEGAVAGEEEAAAAQEEDKDEDDEEEEEEEDSSDEGEGVEWEYVYTSRKTGPPRANMYIPVRTKRAIPQPQPKK